ncbi:cation:proton antiporter [Bacteriovorax sp. PP10]|uniref:Cation:proton antiporter n=1 Tax=Bacteriovorax antarcticus TaxID=3088717 RepID=A0ABU5VVL1_9BACT|nr:cation:proton antiporter [Bacteriovorax sp. PP10]MEA9356982.1 cation:proton antiporter [Bacteriovorax sp. PP10]
MKLTLFYVLSITLGIAAFLGINYYGSMQFGNIIAASSSASLTHASLLRDVLVALAFIIAVARICGILLEKLDQPPVMGEVIGGIIIGPSLLGKFLPGVSALLIPSSTMPVLNIIAQIGIILYMFLMGLELDLKELKKSAHQTFIISHASILLPFVLGSILALFIFQDVAPAGVGFTNFALFMGVSMSITAFPVLARILADKNMTKTAIGSLALSCAAIDDVTAWCLLAFVASRAQGQGQNFLMTYGLCALFILFMLFIMRPILTKWIGSFKNQKSFTNNKGAVFLIAILLSALATEVLGIHAIFGAFLLGLIIPHDSIVAHEFNHKWQDVIRVLMLPAFFAYTGMKTQIGLLNTPQDWLLCLLIIAVATIGKLGGTLISAKALKYSWSESLTLGILMNTRGLVELIVLNVGLDLGIISPRLFTMLVIMAVVTTLMTGVLLSKHVKNKH